MKGFCYVKSHFSLLESNISINDALIKAQKYNYEYLALADNSNLHGSLDFIFQAKQTNIKPLIGIETKIGESDFIYKVIIFANNHQGLENLNLISTKINQKDFIFNWDFLQKQAYGLTLVIVLPTFFAFSEKQNDFLNLVKSQKPYFNNLYLGCEITSDQSYYHKLEKLASLANIKLILANSALFIDQKNKVIPEILHSIKHLQVANLAKNQHQFNYFMSGQEIKDFVSLKIIEATNNFFAKTYFKISFTQARLPSYDVDGNKKTFLKKLCLQGLKHKLKVIKIPSNYLHRLQKELEVILKMNFEDYFLIVWDFMKYASESNIMAGPGRGSAAGSLVAYSLNITKVDPLKYNLLFERFLNVERISMPDIDIDFEDEQRDEVINYVANKYGYDRVFYISTFQTIGAKMAIRDVGRVLDLPLPQVDAISKAIPNKLNITLKQAEQKSLNFKKLIYGSPKTIKLLKLAKLIEGSPRQLGVHAAGIIITTSDFACKLPLIPSKNSSLMQIQYSMYHLEKLGLLKMDFLGIRNLSTIKEIIKDVSKNLGKEINIDQIPLDDKKTFNILSQGMSEGIFQLESWGMKRVLQGLKPNSIEELGTTIALYRPGPMDNIQSYIKRKNKEEKIIYLHPNLKPILNHTQGIIVYQEQIMQIATHVAGFSFAKSDILRQAMSKKKVEEMKQLESDFINGAQAKGYSYQVAHKIYNLIYKFANYGFNASHSISYALVGYQLAYLKAHYPSHFMVSLLSHNIGNTSRIAKYFFEAKRFGISVLPPSVNFSQLNFSYEKKAIRFALLAIKNLGSIASQNIVEERKNNGFFTSFVDFVCRVNARKVSRSCLESLIKAGAFDEFNYSRLALLQALPDVIRYSKINLDSQIESLSKDLLPQPKISNIIDDEQQKLVDEFAVLGLYVSQHPLALLKKQLTTKKGVIRDIINLFDFKQKRVALLVKVNYVRKIKTKQNQDMVFLNIEDDTAEAKAVIFPRFFMALTTLIKKNQIYGLTGIFTSNPKGDSFVIETIKSLKELTT